MQSIKPFTNESEAVSLGELTIENRLDRVSLFGSLDLTRDRRGLDRARDLAAIIGAVVKTLEADKQLPDEIPPPDKSDRAANPFT